ncbi:MAG: hypothetical protein RIQ41_181 [Candidatus Parcubacteria bacterium]|jgi:hypothetical protein
MNKTLALALIFTSLYGISTLPVNAQAVFGPSTQAQPTNSLPLCLQATPGMSYIAIGVQCACPDGSTVWSNDGYTSQCVWNTLPTTPTPVCEVNRQYTFPFYPGAPSCTCPSYSVQTEVLLYPGAHSFMCTYIPTPSTVVLPPACSYYQYWNGYRCVDAWYNELPLFQFQYDYPVNTWIRAPYVRPTGHCADSYAWSYPECSYYSDYYFQAL